MFLSIAKYGELKFRVGNITSKYIDLGFEMHILNVYKVGDLEVSIETIAPYILDLSLFTIILLPGIKNHIPQIFNIEKYQKNMAVNKSVSNIEKFFDDLNSVIESSKELESFKIINNSLISELEDALRATNSKVQKHEETIRIMREAKDEIATKLQGTSFQVAKLEKELAASNSKVEELEVVLRMSNSKVEDLEKELLTANSKVEELEDALHEMNLKVNEISNIGHGLNAQLLSCRCEKMQHEITIVEKDKRIKFLEDQLESMKIAIEALIPK